ncbi:MAG TPA: glycerol-3-phosphate dehydrogenase [Candidatus Limiplasma sp.]|nr:glycerol-3-phosphate dehydrogenase [Candidatus Limiplasma sp.]HRX09251.1 glycerol-3-phosphate dehydrogenase [Candidatus Limiplasma sp.]
MSIITIVGAGMMGSAMSVPARDNGHTVRLVGTHLDREIIAHARKTGEHLTMQRRLPEGIAFYQIEALRQALNGCDLVLCGVSSFGVDWFLDTVVPLIPDRVPVLAVTKGLLEEQDGTLLPFPSYYQHQTGGRLPFGAIGGPCTSYELADRRQTCVAFCGEDMRVLQRLKALLETEYYHISLSTDVLGVECAVAMKNAYALGVTLAVGLIEKEDGIGCTPAYNPQAALFGQSVKEMAAVLEHVGAGAGSIVYGAGDLYVTIFGGRTRKLGTLLGRGIPFPEAIQELSGITLESVVIANRLISAVTKAIQAGTLSDTQFPLLLHVGKLLRGDTNEGIPFARFTDAEM